MPNGDPNWGTKEYPKLEVFFAQFSDVIDTFATFHNLTVDKYYHQSASWSYLFKHPQGGIGKIEIQKLGDEDVMVNPIWWLDDYEMFTRYLKHGEAKKCSITDKDVLRQLLGDALSQVLSWRTTDLVGKPDPVLKRMWHRQWTKEEFGHLNDEYPIPKL